MIRSKRIFIDTSAWIEIILKGEIYHRQVADYFLAANKKGAKFFTCDYVLDEAWTRLITNHSFLSAKFLREKVDMAEKNHHLMVFYSDHNLFDKTWIFFDKYKEHKLSFTDSIIAALMKDFKIDEILTLDKGFKKVGFNVRPLL